MTLLRATPESFEYKNVSFKTEKRHDSIQYLQLKAICFKSRFFFPRFETTKATQISL